jgi:hypothetical protein
LYGNVTWHVVSEAFAGRLPTPKLSDYDAFREERKPFDTERGTETVSSTHNSATRSHASHLIYQLDCDLLMAPQLSPFAAHWPELDNLDVFEIRVRAQDWRGSFLGENCDREAFVQGRQRVLEWTKKVGDLMSTNDAARVVEDTAFQGRSCVRFRVERMGVGKSKNRVLRESERIVT